MHDEKTRPSGAVVDDRLNTTVKQPPKQRVWLHGLLFGVTFLTAAWAQLPLDGTTSYGTALQAALTDPSRLQSAFLFAATLMLILLAHEMGHYITAHKLGVDQSLPYFIPAPTLVGTFGAIILMRSQPADRSVLLRVAVMGPLCGLVPALVAVCWGLANSSAATHLMAGGPPTYGVGSSLLFFGLRLMFAPEAAVLELHPVAFAGWVGMFVTCLNLIPAAQLDGGHIAYALWGRAQTRISLFAIAALMVVGGVTVVGGPQRNWGGIVWMFWAVMLFVVGLAHPAVRDEARPLRRAERLAGWGGMVLFVVTFIPAPLWLVDKAPAYDAVEELIVPPGASSGAMEDDDWERPSAAEEFRL